MVEYDNCIVIVLALQVLFGKCIRDYQRKAGSSLEIDLFLRIW